MKPSSLPRVVSRSRRDPHIELFDEELHHFAHSPRRIVENAVPVVAHLSFNSWMSGGGLRPHLN